MTNAREGVTQVVQRLHDEYGEVRASQLVEAARPADSPAHGGFEWDDDKASEQYRLIQARQWCKEVHIIVENKSEPLWHVPSVRGGDDGFEGLYRCQSVVVTLIDERERALEQLATAMRSATDSFNRFRFAIDQNPTRADRSRATKMKRGLGIMQAALDHGRRPVRAAKTATGRAKKAR